MSFTSGNTILTHEPITLLRRPWPQAAKYHMLNLHIIHVIFLPSSCEGRKEGRKLITTGVSIYFTHIARVQCEDQHIKQAHIVLLSCCQLSCHFFATVVLERSEPLWAQLDQIQHRYKKLQRQPCAPFIKIKEQSKLQKRLYTMQCKSKNVEKKRFL